MKTGREIIVVEKEHISVVIIKKKTRRGEMGLVGNGDWYKNHRGENRARNVKVGGDWLKDDCD